MNAEGMFKKLGYEKVTFDNIFNYVIFEKELDNGINYSKSIVRIIVDDEDFKKELLPAPKLGIWATGEVSWVYGEELEAILQQLKELRKNY